MGCFLLRVSVLSLVVATASYSKLVPEIAWRGDGEGRGFSPWHLVDVLGTSQLSLDRDEILSALLKKEAFLRHLPGILQEVMSPEAKEELAKSLLDILEHYYDKANDEQVVIDDFLRLLLDSMGVDERQIQSSLGNRDVDVPVKKLPDWLIKKIIDYIKDHLQDIIDLILQFIKEHWEDIKDWIIKLIRKYIQDHWQEIIDWIENYLKDHWDVIKEKLLAILEKVIQDHWEEIMSALSKILNDLLQGTLSKYYLPVGDGVSEDCRNVVDEFFLQVGGDDSDVLHMIDSWGKLPDGFLFGNLITLGVFEECVESRTSYAREDYTMVTYKGRYCKVTYSNPSGVTFDGLSLFGKVAYAHGLLGYGTCIPSICTSQDLAISLNKTLSDLKLQVSTVNCKMQDTGSINFTPDDKAMISLISIFLILVTVATIFDVITGVLDFQKLRQGVWQGVIGFSFSHNLKQVFTYKEKPKTEVITCMAAMKVMTMTWIIICHQYNLDLTFIANFNDALKYQDSIIAEIVTNGWLAADTFFCLTGIVLAYNVLPALEIQSKCSVAWVFCKTFVRRFFRLSPTILFVALFSASLLPYLTTGPMSYKMDEFSEECRKYWWKDVIFVNNYMFEESDGVHFKDCLVNCWYTAIDMQLVLILPVLLLPFAYSSLAGGIIYAVVFVASIITPMIITIVNEFPPSPIQYMSLRDHFEYNWQVYIVPWCRAGPWLVGIGTGVLLRHRRIANLKLHKFVVICGYIIAVGLTSAILLGLFPFNHVYPQKDYKDYPAVNAAYGSMARHAWGICIAFIIFCCHTGNSDVVNQILSYPGWRPLARICYPMFLVAPVVQEWWLDSRLSANYYNYLEKLFQSAGTFFISGMIALALTCFVERPICNLINMIFPLRAPTTEVTPVELLEKRDGNKDDLNWLQDQLLDYSFRKPHVSVMPTDTRPYAGYPPDGQYPQHLRLVSEEVKPYVSSMAERMN